VTATAYVEGDCTKSCEKISRLVTLRHTFPPLIQPRFPRRSVAHGDSTVTAYAAAERTAA